MGLHNVPGVARASGVPNLYVPGHLNSVRNQHRVPNLPSDTRLLVTSFNLILLDFSNLL